jgi:GxxExxY protein
VRASSRVYENALAHELRDAGFQIEQQPAARVRYDGIVVDNYVIEIVVKNTFLLEIKAILPLEKIHDAQRLNYLRATGLKLCLLFTFGNPQVEIRRFANRL